MDETAHEGEGFAEEDFFVEDTSIEEDEDSESDSNFGSFRPSEVVRLPIGLTIDGTMYRTFHIDEMSGYDDEALANKKHRNNGAKSMTALLRRCIQKIDGLMEKKKNRYGLVAEQYVRKMFTPDRDFLFVAIRALGMEPTFDIGIVCPKCADDYDHVVVLNELDVLDWDEERPELHITLPKGFEKNGKFFDKVTWRFGTGAQQERIVGLPKSKITTSTIANCVVAVEGLDRRPDSEMCRRLRTRDRMYLLNQVREMTPGVDLRVDCFCESCENEWVGEVDPSRFFNMGEATTVKPTKRGRRGLKRRKKRSRKR